MTVETRSPELLFSHPAFQYAVTKCIFNKSELRLTALEGHGDPISFTVSV